MSQASPVSSSQRLETLDVVRGFALLGILAMNIRVMAGPFGAYMYPYGLFDYAGANRAAYLFTATAFDLKMMGLFSMLFGVSVLLYAAKPTVSTRTLRGLWFRRMFWLLVIGLVHAYLIWNGDILVPYALCGMLVLWWVRRLSPTILFALAGVVLLAGAGLSVGHAMSWDSMSDAEQQEELLMYRPAPDELRAEVDVLRSGYGGIVAYRAPLVFMFQTFVFAVFFFWRCSGMMLLGMALYKIGFLDGRRPAGAYATVASICLPVGLGLAWYGAWWLDRSAYAMPDRLLLDLWNYTGAVFASVGYAALLILIVKRGALAALRRSLAAVGQMALTNYLLQSVVTAVLFLGWGVGLAGTLDYATQLIVVLAIWVAELIWSPLWLARFRFGPAEWAWRSLTYWQRQPFRHQTPELSLTGATG